MAASTLWLCQIRFILVAFLDIDLMQVPAEFVTFRSRLIIQLALLKREIGGNDASSIATSEHQRTQTVKS